MPHDSAGSPVTKIHDAIRTVILKMGDDPNRPGLVGTPERVYRSWGELFAGYRERAEDLFKTFDEPHDEMVLVSGVDFVSFCEHHLLPVQGYATVAYVPDGRVVGLSKLARVVDIYARRLQLQERMTCQITDAIEKHLKPKGCACLVHATHMCLSCRGARKQNAIMTTSSLRGVFKSCPATRSEFLQLAEACFVKNGRT